MELTFTSPKSTELWTGCLRGLLLGTLFASALAVLDHASCLWLTIPGIVPACLLPALNGKRKRLLGILCAVAVIAFFSFRASAIINGLKLLANAFFAESEALQSYEYDYFITDGGNPREGVLFIGALLGIGVGIWKAWALWLSVGAWASALMYFGVTPPVGYMAAFAFFALLCAGCSTPSKWMHGVFCAVAVCCVALIVMRFFPSANSQVSQWEESARDLLAINTVAYEQQAEPTVVPTPEEATPPPSQEASPNQGVSAKHVVNVLLIVFSLLTLLCLFVPALINDRAKKLREKNRAGIEDADNAAAIRAMYLYMRRWQAYEKAPQALPRELEEVWLEAAFSSHKMTDEQRQAMSEQLRKTTENVRNEASKWERFRLKYIIAL